MCAEITMPFLKHSHPSYTQWCFWMLPDVGCFESNIHIFFFLTFRVDLFVCGQIIIWMDVWTDKVNEEVNERIDREIDRVIILTRSHILQTFIRNCLFSSVLTHTMLISSCVVFVICCCRHRYESIFITSWRFPFKLNYGKSGCFFLILFSLR